MSIKTTFLALTLSLAGAVCADVIQPCGETTAKASTDAATIQAAIDTAGAGGTVTLDEGTFYLKDALAVTNGVTLAGQGWDKTILKPASGLAWAGIRCACLDGGAKLTSVTVTGFSYYSSWAGGVAVQVKDGTVSWCSISNNTSTGYNVYGGAIELKKGAVDHSVIANNKINNSGSGAGIGGYNVSGPCLIDSCLVSGNAMPNSEGGGICFTQGSPEVTIRNTTIVGNSSKNSGAGLKVGISKLTLMNCIISGNMKGETEDNVSGTPKTSTTNFIGGDPKFKDAANGDYHLTGTSPAKFAGTTYAGIGRDLDNVAFAAAPSVGCYEYAASTTVVEKPEIDPPTRAYVSPLQVTMNCLTDGATIRYTTDGSDPTESSAAYADPFEVAGATTTVKARAYKAGMDPSEVVSALYTYEAPVPPAFGTVTVTPKPKKATLSGTVATVGNDGATACDVYLAFGTDAANLPTPTKVATGVTAAFEYVMTGLTPETAYYYALSISNNAATVRGDARNGNFETLSMAGAIEPCANAAENREAIQDAIDAASTEAEPGTVTLSTGTFLIDAQLMVTGGVTLVGQGWTNTVVKQTTSGQRCATVNNGSKLVGVTLTGGRLTAGWNHGAGVSIQDGTVSWCCISNNVCTGRNIHGGGVNFTKGTIDHSIVAFNQAGTYTSSGGGIGSYNSYGTILIDACLVYGNTVSVSDVSGEGGGIGLNGGNPVLKIRNTTITENAATSAGGGLGIGTGHKNVTLVNVIVSANKVGGTENNVSGTLTADSSNNFIGGDPGFKDAANRDYSLTVNSPARGTGVTYEDIGTDLADAPFANPPSIGCYEYVSSLTVVENPFFEPETGAAFSTPMPVTLVCGTDGATIHYTTDGSDPTVASEVYAEPVVVSETTTVKALAVKAGMEPSEVVSATYTYEDPVPPELGELTVVPDRNKAKFVGEIVSVGNDWATACDVYVAVGTNAGNLPAATKVFGGAVDSFKFAVPDLEPETTYSYTLFVSNNAATARGVSTSGTFTTRATPLAIEPAGSPAETRLAIQEALDDEATLTTPGTVLLAEGLFEIDAQLTLNGGVTLAGQGWDKTIIKQTVAGQRCATVNNGARLMGVTLTGGRTTANWTHGAGVSIQGGTVSWCCISNNVATAYNIYGTGVEISKGTIDHSVIAYNLAWHSGAGAGIGAYGASGPCVIDTCLVYGNTMPESEGGGIGFSQGNPKVTIRNTTITGNSSANAGAGLKVGVSQLSLVNCIVSGNKMGETEDNVSGTLAADSSNNLIDGDPKFKDAEANDYRLGPGSPAQNAGVRYEGLDRDLDNVSFAKKPSMGCYERRCGLTVILK